MYFFKNFKNFADVEIDLSKPMTVLIGRNGSGKSNLIEGVELLAKLLSKIQLSRITDVGLIHSQQQFSDFEIRGGLNGCFRQGYEQFVVGFKEKVTVDDKEETIFYQIQFFNENLNSSSNEDNFESLSLAILNDFKHIKDEKLLANIREDSIKSITKVLKNNYIKKYDEVKLFDINLNQLKMNYPRTIDSNGGLYRDCSNLSLVLYKLSENSPEKLKTIFDNINKFPEEDLEKFEFIKTNNADDTVLVALKYTNGQVINAKLLSDGTLRALAILTALETVPEGSRIIIEEIDNGIHASRVNVLLNAIWESSNRRNLHTLITTHNPATLDNLTEEQLDGVVVCHYDKASQSAKLTPFFEIPRAILLLEEGLGKSAIRNLIEQYLDPDYEKQHSEESLSWLESLND